MLGGSQQIFGIPFVAGMKPFTWNEEQILRGWWSKLQRVDIIFVQNFQNSIHHAQTPLKQKKKP